MSKVAFYLFERKHGKENMGSSRIRGHWLIKEWPEAEELKWSKEYDVVIYQKVYQTDMAKQWDKIQILDLADPDWLSYDPVKEMIVEMDAVTVSSRELRKAVKELTDKPVRYIPDGVLEMGKRKEHEGKAKELVWFGYSHNDYVLRDAEDTIRDLGLDLTVISDASYQSDKIDVNWIKWESQEQCNKELQKGDIALLPHANTPKYMYKSRNRTFQSWALGLPVAHTGDDLRRLLDGKEREKKSKEKWQLVKDKYMTKHSVEKFKELINELTS